MVLQCEGQCISREVLCSKALSGSTFLTTPSGDRTVIPASVFIQTIVTCKPAPMCWSGRHSVEPANPKNWPAYYWTNPVMKRTSSRGISSVLSHLFGHGSGNFVHSSARCACGRKTVIIWPIDWIDGRNTFTEYMHLSGYEFRSDLHQNVLCCPEYISSAKLVNSSL